MNPDCIRISFGSTGEHLFVRIESGDQETEYAADPQDVEKLPSLPEAISNDISVEEIAGQYQKFLRGLRKNTASASGVGPNSMERIFSHIGDRKAGMIDLRFVAGGDCAWVGGRPWELLLHDPERDQLQDRLLRVASVRTLGATNNYSPRRIDGKLRVLLLQGADGPQALDFAGEREGLEAAWNALGPALQRYVDRPVIRPAQRDQIAAYLEGIRPHLVWFSGHGQSADDEFRLLLGHGAQADWAPSSIFADIFQEAAKKSGVFPMVAAFWACEGGRAPRPSLYAGDKSFPQLVKSILDVGVEAVVGVQTQIYNTSARVMGTELFRCLAEGLGPAQSLAAARVKLLGLPKSRTAPGRGSEWTSPVMWINGADLPAIEWGRPLEEDEALAFYRLGTESFLLFEGGADILQEPPDLSQAPAAMAWVEQAPIWIVCRNLNMAEEQLKIVRRLRDLVTSEDKVALIFHFDSLKHESVLDAVADGFGKLQLRAFPKAKNEAWDFLSSLFAAFQRGGGREKAWVELLKRPDMVIAILADGGLPPSEAIQDAGKAALIVFSSRPADDGQGIPTRWEGWHADDLESEIVNVMPKNEAVTGFLAAFATLNKPLSQMAMAELAHDFDLNPKEVPGGEYLARLGQRHVVKASVARHLLDAMSPDRKRAAHRACMGLLTRLPDEFHASFPEQSVWLVQHSLGAEEIDAAIERATAAIRQFSESGDHHDVVRVFRMLGLRWNRRLSASSQMDAAFSFTQTGDPKRALGVLRGTPISSESIEDRLRFAVVKAEALRNLADGDRRKESIATLDEAIQETKGNAELSDDAKRLLLVARHDLARNIHYFRKDASTACAMFRQVISECGENPGLAYLKAAASRNLADAVDRYTYGKIERDPKKAESLLTQAVAIAQESPSARALLPELLYRLAKYHHPDRPGDAGYEIGQAIEFARKHGAGQVLSLAKNKLFWWKLGPFQPDGSPTLFDSREWARLEKELVPLAGHPWPVRALIDSRICAAKWLRLGGRSVEAAEVLGRARDLLLDSRVLDYEGDWIRRWLPVFAGLAILNRSEATYTDEEDLWADLRIAATRANIDRDIPKRSPKRVWDEVQC